MSGNLNIVNPTRKKKILIIAANPGVSSQTGWPVGFWWAEVTHPYHAFVEAGRRVLLLDVGDEAGVVPFAENLVDRFGSCGHALLHPGAKAIGLRARARK